MCFNCDFLCIVYLFSSFVNTLHDFARLSVDLLYMNCDDACIFLFLVISHVFTSRFSLCFSEHSIVAGASLSDDICIYTCF